jgi:hypothetical protein
MAGVRWQMHMTGPLYFGVRVAGASVDERLSIQRSWLQSASSARKRFR